MLKAPNAVSRESPLSVELQSPLGRNALKLEVLPAASSVPTLLTNWETSKAWMLFASPAEALLAADIASRNEIPASDM